MDLECLVLVSREWLFVSELRVGRFERVLDSHDGVKVLGNAIVIRECV